MGLLAMRLGDRTLLNICFGFTVIGALLLFLNVNDALSLLGLIGIGFGLAAVFPILILQTNERVGRDHAVNAIGFPSWLRRFGWRGAFGHGRRIRGICRSGIDQLFHFRGCAIDGGAI